MRVTFVAGDGEERFVRYGEGKERLGNSAPARGVRYEREHMCNAPANTTIGWRDPGWIFYAVMKNLNGGVRYYYQVNKSESLVLLDNQILGSKIRLSLLKIGIDND